MALLKIVHVSAVVANPNAIIGTMYSGADRVCMSAVVVVIMHSQMVSYLRRKGKKKSILQDFSTF